MDAAERLDSLGGLAVIVFVAATGDRGGGVADDKVGAEVAGGFEHTSEPGAAVGGDGEMLEAEVRIKGGEVGLTEPAPDPGKVLAGVGEAVLFVEVEDSPGLAGREAEKWLPRGHGEGEAIA